MKKLKFPVTISEGGVTAKIRKSDQTKNGETYTLFVVDYFLLGKRKREARASFEEAREVALNACRQIANGNHVLLTLANDDRLTYLRAVEASESVGVKLDVAAREYVSAVKELPPGVTLKDAVDFFCRRNAAALEIRTVRQVADEMIAAKRAAKLSDVHLDDLEYRLKRLADDFQMNIANVSGKMLQAWLDAMNVGGRTKQNYLRHVAALVRFAIKRKYLPKDALEEIEAVETPKQDAGEIEIFTPDEMREILAVARPEMVPWLAIAGFAGLRSAELARLDWSEVNLQELFIEVKAAKAKTAARRIIPITDNLAQWLTPHAKKSGSVVGFRSWWNQIPKIADAVNQERQRNGLPQDFKWCHNALRHSFCSYRLAAIKNAAQVALEAGNSPQMIFKHYRQVVTEAEAAKWFAIAPAVSLPLAVVENTPAMAA